MTSEDKGIRAKIAKLIAKAESTTHEGEAMVFLAKAEELMNKHQLDLADLSDDEMGKEVTLTGTSSSPTWQRHLMHSIAVYYGATTVRSFKYKGGKEYFDLEVLGPESARVTVQAMYPFIIKQVRQLGRETAPLQGLSTDASIRRVANALNTRIWGEIRARKAEEMSTELPGTSAATSHALVVKKQDLLKSYVESVYPHLQKSASRGTRTNDAARAAASKVSLHRQTGGGSVKRIGR